MRVDISAYLMHEGPDYRSAGVSTYTHELLAHLPLVAPQHRYVAFHGADAPLTSPAASVVSPVPTRNPLVRIAWEQTALPLGAALGRADVLHGTVNVVPLLGRTRKVVTVHDLAFLRQPGRFPRAKGLYLRWMVRQSCRLADRVIAVSAATKRDVATLLEVPEDRIAVVYSGADPQFRRLPEADIIPFRTSVFGGRPYLLHVGTLEPRKNIDVLIRAFHELRTRESIPHVLCLVGAVGWMYQSVFALVQALGLQKAVDFRGYVPAEQLPLWYNAADLFALPSAYEGFGLPLVEAMACGTPAVVSGGGALEEIGGSACLTVEAGSTEALRVAMERVLSDESLRLTMRRAGLERAKRFRWEATAAATARVYEEAVGTA